MKNHIERTLLLSADIRRVWTALTDHREFGQWFGVKLDAPFVTGQVSTGTMLMTDCKSLDWRADVVAMDAPHRFAYRWHPYDVDPDRDLVDEPQTLVEFLLTEVEQGTQLLIRESGFDQLPDAARRAEAYRQNSKGWDYQSNRITQHLDG